MKRIFNSRAAQDLRPGGNPSIVMTKRNGTLVQGLRWLLCLILIATAESPGFSQQSGGASQISENAKPENPAPEVEAASDSTSSGEWGRNREMVGIRHPVRLPAKQVARSVVAVLDNAEILGRVRHAAVVIGGNVMVDGEVGGNLVVILGSATLGPHAEVHGQTVVIGGTLKADPQAKLHGDPVEIPLPGFESVAGWLRSGLMVARPLPPQLPMAWYIAAVLFGINVLAGTLFPRQSQTCLGSLDQSPTGALVAGFLGISLIIPLIVLLAVTVVGILAIPFVICAFIGAALFGKVIVYRFAGQQLGSQIRLDAAKSPVLGLALGTALFYLLYTVPVIGFMVWGVSTVLGLGAVLLTVGRVMRGDGKKADPVVLVSQMTTADPAGVSPGDPSSPPAGTMPGAASALGWSHAGFWVRGTAALLDLILVGFLSVLTHFPPSVLLLLPVYYLIMWSWKGTSVGAIVMGLKVIRTDGREMDFAASLVRVLSSFFSLMVLGLGFLWIAWDREHQAWHDKIAGTLVVRAPRGVSLV